MHHFSSLPRFLNYFLAFLAILATFRLCPPNFIFSCPKLIPSPKFEICRCYQILSTKICFHAPPNFITRLFAIVLNLVFLVFLVIFCHFGSFPLTSRYNAQNWYHHRNLPMVPNFEHYLPPTSAKL